MDNNIQNDINNVLTQTCMDNNTSYRKERALALQEQSNNINNTVAKQFLDMFTPEQQMIINKYSPAITNRLSELPSVLLPFFEPFVSSYGHKQMEIENKNNYKHPEHNVDFNKGTVFEFNNYFAKIISKDNLNEMFPDKNITEDQVLFFPKNKNITKDMLNNDNIYSIYNNQAVGLMEFMVPSGQLLKYYNKYDGVGECVNNANTNELGNNEFYHFLHLYNSIINNNYDYNKNNYIALNDKIPVTEYIYKNPYQFDLMPYDILINGNSKNKSEPLNKIYRDTYENNGYSILNHNEYKNNREMYLNNGCANWMEITKNEYMDVKNNINNNHIKDYGFFEYNTKKDIQCNYYKEHYGRYFKSLQRTTYNPEYIKANFDSYYSRLIPAKYVIPSVISMFERDFKKDDDKYEPNKALNIIQDLKNSGNTKLDNNDINFINYFKNIKLINNDNMVNINNKVFNHKTYNNNDNIIYNHIFENINNKDVTHTQIFKLFNDIGFKGNTDTFTSNILSQKYNSSKELSKYIDDNCSMFMVVKPTIKEIKSYITNNSINVLHENSKTNNKNNYKGAKL